MKKLIVVLIIMVYGLSSTGAVVHLEYCCGKLFNISLAPSPMEDCKGKGMKAKGCCDSKQVQLKVKGEQEAAMKWISSQKQSNATISLATKMPEVINAYKPADEFATGPPLLHSSVPLFIQHCLFRI